MAKKKKGGDHGGGHGWFVTFADLMALMMSFFVMLVAFSNQDQQKLQIVAGSMRDAFGVQSARFSGVIETDGIPTRSKVKNAANVPPSEASDRPGPEDRDPDRSEGARLKKDRDFALAAASLRQALQDMPEFGDMSRNIMFEETKDGLNIELVDQDGRSMFAEGSREPYDRTRRILEKFARPLRDAPFRIAITGHTAASFRRDSSAYSAFELSADRANAVREILEREGMPSSHLFMVAGKGDTQPLFPDDPRIAANRRVTITLMRESPAVPPALKP